MVVSAPYLPVQELDQSSLVTARCEWVAQWSQWKRVGQTQEHCTWAYITPHTVHWQLYSGLYSSVLWLVLVLHTSTILWKASVLMTSHCTIATNWTLHVGKYVVIICWNKPLSELFSIGKKCTIQCPLKQIEFQELLDNTKCTHYHQHFLLRLPKLQQFKATLYIRRILEYTSNCRDYLSIFFSHSVCLFLPYYKLWTHFGQLWH